MAPAGCFLRGLVARAGFGDRRNSRRTRCNLNGGSGFCRFMRLRAAGCERLRSRISRRTLSSSPEPRLHQPRGSTRRRTQRPQSGGRGTSGSAALPPSMSVPATWQAGSCRSPGQAASSQIGKGSGGRIWGLLMDQHWGPSGIGRRRYTWRGCGCWRAASGWSEFPHASPLYDSSHHLEATNKR